MITSDKDVLSLSPVGSVPAMGSHVSCDAAGLGELAIANVATEWFLATMGSAMCGQVGGLRKGFVTLDTPSQNTIHICYK